jgi:hypothetical protein
MTTSANPYAGKPETKWKAITRRLVAGHPLKEDVIREVALVAWAKVWQTTIGSGTTAIPLSELNVPALVVGYFFEALFAREMQSRFPAVWRGNRSKEEKDLVCLQDPHFSVEIKTSGQFGWKVYGNRSYSQPAQREESVKKEKSGYYLTVNFYARALTLLRFGWIDVGDWQGQAAQTGQMAGLPDKVYQHKLIVIPGKYRLQAPVGLLKGVGEKTVEKLRGLGIQTIGHLLSYQGELPKGLKTIRGEAKTEYALDESSPE